MYMKEALRGKSMARTPFWERDTLLVSRGSEPL